MDMILDELKENKADHERIEAGMVAVKADIVKEVHNIHINFTKEFGTLNTKFETLSTSHKIKTGIWGGISGLLGSAIIIGAWVIANMPK